MLVAVTRSFVSLFNGVTVNFASHYVPYVLILDILHAAAAWVQLSAI